MHDHYAILLDGGFVLRKLRRNDGAAEVVAECKRISGKPRMHLYD